MRKDACLSVSLFVFVCLSVGFLFPSVCARMNACVYLCTYAYHVCMHACMLVCMCLCVYVCLYV